MAATEEYAKAKALYFLNGTGTGEEYAIVRIQTEAFGWIMFYNTRKYVVDGDFKGALVGHVPLVVDKDTGKVHFLKIPPGIHPPSDGLDVGIAAYRHQRVELGRSHDEVDFSTE